MKGVGAGGEAAGVKSSTAGNPESKEILIQDRKRLLPDEKERPPISFIMAAWRFQGTKQYQLVLCHILEEQEGSGWGKGRWQ